MLRKKVLIFGCIFILALSALGMAQGMMGGSRGMGGNGGMHGSGSMGGSGGMGLGVGMDGSAMGMSNGAVTVGSDGTLYVLSRVLPQPSQGALTADQIKTKLSALDGKRGITLWSIVFDENWLTRPVQGPDGRLFLVALGHRGMGMFRTGADQPEDAKLYVVDPATQNVINTATLTGEVASLPTISESDGNYTVFVVSFDMGHDIDSRGQFQGPHRDAALTAFDRDGKPLYTLPLDQ